MIQRMERQFAGRTLSLEFGRMAKLAQGSCLVQYGDTVVLCAVTVQDNPTHRADRLLGRKVRSPRPKRASGPVAEVMR